MNSHASIGVMLAVLCHGAHASSFIADSTAQLQVRNFYFDRDFRSGAGQSQAQEWAQGFILNLASGYTEGPVGFGLNAVGMLGIKLDSGPGRTGTGLLSFDSASREVNDEYSKFGVAAKARISRSELQVGTLQPTLPVALANTMRLFPPLLEGAYFKSQEIDGLTLHAASFDRITLRDSTNSEHFTISSPNRRFNGAATSDELNVLGADYLWSDQLSTRYYHAQLKDLYVQDYVDALHTVPFGQYKLKSDIRVFSSREDGKGAAGKVDNRTLSSMFTLQSGPHAVGLGYMQLWGDTALPYVGGTSVNVNSEGLLVSEFVNPKERTWQLRYDYDFAALGAPGLRAMWRYVKGTDIELPGFDSSVKESERDIELAYAVQSGPLRGVAVRLRQANYQSDFARDVDELRINVDYTFKLW